MSVWLCNLCPSKTCNLGNRQTLSLDYYPYLALTTLKYFLCIFIHFRDFSYNSPKPGHTTLNKRHPIAIQYDMAGIPSLRLAMIV